MGAEVAQTEAALAVVTGGAGFIGSHLTDALLAAGWRVRVLDNLSNGRRSNLEAHPLLDFVEGDICDLETCQRVFESAHWVFHQAAMGSVPRSLEFPTATLAANVGGTTNVLTAARDCGVSRVIYASSSSVYGDSEVLPKKEGGEGRSLSPYALSKWMGEELAELYGRVYNLETVGLRYFNVYGPRQDPNGAYAAVIPKFVAAMLRGESPTIHGDGEQSRDFTFVADAVAANLAAAVAPPEACGRAYNVARGDQTTVNELVAILREILEIDLSATHGPERPGDVAHSLADLTLISQALGFAAATSLEAGLRRSIGFYRGLASA